MHYGIPPFSSRKKYPSFISCYGVNVVPFLTRNYIACKLAYASHQLKCKYTIVLCVCVIAHTICCNDFVVVVVKYVMLNKSINITHSFI
jgi:hypothetical protein